MTAPAPQFLCDLPGYAAIITVEALQQSFQQDGELHGISRYIQATIRRWPRALSEARKSERRALGLGKSAPAGSDTCP